MDRAVNQSAVPARARRLMRFIRADSIGLFHEHEIDGGHEETESKKMIPPDLETFERPETEYHKHRQRDHFLNHLQLNQRKRPSVAFEPYTVGRHLKTILKQCDAPRQQDNSIERPVCGDTAGRKLQMPVPGKCHEHV